MGNFCQCSCNTKPLDPPLNLSQKFSNDIKSASGFSNTIFKDSFMGEKKEVNISEASAVQLTRLCRGYLLRRRFNSSMREELILFQHDLYESFQAKATAYLPANIWDYTPDQWSSYSIGSIIHKDNSNLIYFDRIAFEYDPNTSTASSRYNSTSKELAEVALSAYKGALDKSNKKIGFGTLIFSTGKMLRGFWVSNEFTGWNEVIEPNGTIMLGEFTKGILNGKGEQFNFFNKQELYYKGDYCQGKREGQGVEIIKNCIFEGEFIDNMKTKGKATYESGDSYEGSFENNLFNKEGHYKWKSNGHEYIGGYKDGKYHGLGTYKWSDTEYYKGEYLNGIKHGHGELHMKKGIVYIGPFVNGLMDGVGDYQSANYTGKVEFINGQLNKNYVPKKKNLFRNIYKKRENGIKDEDLVK